MTEANSVGVRFMAAVHRSEALDNGPRGASLLCTACAQLVPMGRAAIMVCTGGQKWEMLGASDDVAAQWAQAQAAAGEGPGPQAYLTDAPVLVPELDSALAADRWPLLAASGLGDHAGAVFAFPLHQGAIRVGTLDLYNDTAITINRTQFSTAVEIADLITVILLAAVRATPISRDEIEVATNGDTLGPWWEVAVSTREIHQATGMVAIQLGVDIATAYARLIAHALSTSHPVAQLAADVVARRIRFHPDDSAERGPDTPGIAG